MGNTDANLDTGGQTVLSVESPSALPPLPLPLPPPPRPKPPPTANNDPYSSSVSVSFPDAPVSSVVALLVEVQDKLERHRQLRWLKLDKFQNARSEYTTVLQTTLKEVEEQAKRRNRVQLASFLRQETRSREVGHGLVEEALAGLESRWQKAHDSLAATLQNVLLEARHEEQEWNEMLRRLAAEEQARMADELPAMLRAAAEAWKTEDQAEESWRNAWETTNLTLERLSQRVHQPIQQSPSSAQARRKESLMSNGSGDGNENENDGAGVRVAALNSARRKSIVKTRRMTETRRHIEASTSTASTSSTSTSISTSTSNVSVSVSVEESESQTSNEEHLVDLDHAEELHYIRAQTRSHEYKFHQQDQKEQHHHLLQQQRQYLYSPIKNQMPSQELFDESLERISPDPKVHSTPNVNASLKLEHDPGVVGVRPAATPLSTSTSSSAEHLHPHLSSRSVPTSPRAKNIKTEMKVNTTLSANDDTKHVPTTPTRKSTVSTTRSPQSQSQSQHQSQPQPQPQLQPQSQPQLRRKTSLKRAASSTSIRTSVSVSASTNSPSRHRVTSSPSKPTRPPLPTAASAPPSVPSPSSPSLLYSSPSVSTVKDGVEILRRSASYRKARPSKANTNVMPETDKSDSPNKLPSIDTTDNRKYKESTGSETGTSTSTNTPALTPTTAPTPLTSSCTFTSWTGYEARWRMLKSSSSLTFSDIPWPVATSVPIMNIEGIDPHLVAEFILSSSSSSDQQPQQQQAGGSLKKRIRAALLRWHPDRFNATILKNVVKQDRKAVQDGVGKVVRILNDMLAKEGGASGNGSGSG